MRAVGYPQTSLEERLACGPGVISLGVVLGGCWRAQTWQNKSKACFPCPRQSRGKGEFGKDGGGNGGRAFMARGNEIQLCL